MVKTWNQLGNHKQIIIRKETLGILMKLQAKLYVKEGKRPSYNELIVRMMKKSGGKI